MPTWISYLLSATAVVLTAFVIAVWRDPRVFRAMSLYVRSAAGVPGLIVVLMLFGKSETTVGEDALFLLLIYFLALNLAIGLLLVMAKVIADARDEADKANSRQKYYGRDNRRDRGG